MEPVTESELNVMMAIDDAYERNSWNQYYNGPSRRELGRELGMTTAWTQTLVTRLIKKGRVSRVKLGPGKGDVLKVISEDA